MMASRFPRVNGNRYGVGPEAQPYGFHYVYILRGGSLDAPRYVGFTGSPRSRWLGHMSNARQEIKGGSPSRLTRWVAGLLDSGVAPLMEIVDRQPFPQSAYKLKRRAFEAAARALESAYIDFYFALGAPLFNVQGAA